jgi:hypothetical protein
MKLHEIISYKPNSLQNRYLLHHCSARWRRRRDISQGPSSLATSDASLQAASERKKKMLGDIRYSFLIDNDLGRSDIPPGCHNARKDSPTFSGGGPLQTL